MKELSIKDKAKAYDEALERAKELTKKEGFATGTILHKEVLEHIFPELKESEDERIELLNYLYDVHDDDEERARWIAWFEKQGEHANFLDKIQVGDKVTRNEDGVLVNLSQLKRVAKKDEKQGEQKPTDKTEPKFKVGDWVVTSYGKVNQVVSVDKDGDGYTLDDGVYFSGSWCDMYHLWTIQDAKEGDVLACPNDAGDRDVVFIFKNINSDEGWVFCFCASDANGCFCTNNDYVGNSNSTNISPATKEQRDLLFKKMHEAGYEWDADKKELKKIYKKPVEWSEEDEKTKDNLISELSNLATRRLIKNETYSKYSSWLKSLRPQNTWKPSEEQMKALSNAGNSFRPFEEGHKVLWSLYNDLKKLREK